MTVTSTDKIPELEVKKQELQPDRFQLPGVCWLGRRDATSSYQTQAPGADN